jgi:uncharacterized protein with HEPN domain
MLEAGLEAREFARGRTLDDLSTERMLLLSLVKEIEIIGEAATAVSEELRSATSDIPWAKIKGMRNGIGRSPPRMQPADRQALKYTF